MTEQVTNVTNLPKSTQLTRKVNRAAKYAIAGVGAALLINEVVKRTRKSAVVPSEN